MSCSMSIEENLWQSMSNAIRCINQRCALKNSGISCLALIQPKQSKNDNPAIILHAKKQFQPSRLWKRTSHILAGFYKHSISFATNLSTNFGCDLEINSESYLTTIWNGSAVWSESEQSTFSRTSIQFRPAALHRILFGTCSFVPMPYFYS